MSIAGFRVRECPFCKASGLAEKKGRLTCTYCLEEIEYDSSELSLGFSHIQSGDFDLAKNIFKDGDTPEKIYGLFLCENKIIENRGRDGSVRPVIYAYRPESFNNDKLFLTVKKANANQSIVLKKLDEIEKAREKAFSAKSDTDVIIKPCIKDLKLKDFTDKLSNQLTKLGYTVKLLNDISYDFTLLRYAKIFFAVCEKEEDIDDLKNTNVIKNFSTLNYEAQNNQKRAVILHNFDIDSVFMGNISQYAAMFKVGNDQSAAAFLSSIVLPRPRLSSEIELFNNDYSQSRSFSVSTKTDKVIAGNGTVFEPLPGEEGQRQRIRDYLKAGDFTRADELCQKMIREGCKNSEVFFSRILAKLSLESGAALSKKMPQFPKEIQDLFKVAIEKCVSRDEADGYFNILFAAAHNALSAHRPLIAQSYLNIVYSYNTQSCDVFADSLISEAKKIFENENFILMNSLFFKILDNSKTSDGKFQYDNRAWFIGFAIKKKQFYAAAEHIDSLLKASPFDTKQLYNKLFLQNEVSDEDEFFAKNDVILAETYERILQSQGSREQVIKTLQTHFDRFFITATARGSVKAFDRIFLNLINYKVGSDGVSKESILNLADASLEFREFNTAFNYYSYVITLDKNSYRAYFGMLKAELSCVSDADLQYADKDITEYKNYYHNAYTCAFNLSDTVFCQMCQNIASRRQNIKFINGFTYQPLDFIIENSRIVRYIGKNVDNVYVDGMFYGINKGAFYGADVKSVFIANGITDIEDEAFASCTELTSVIIPDSVRKVGVNPFAGCMSLSSITCGSNFIYTDGILYFKDGQGLKAIFASEASPCEVTLLKDTYAIGDKCFYENKNITTLNLPHNILSVGINAFYDSAINNITNLKNAELPSSVFGDTAFTNKAYKNGIVSRDNAVDLWDSLLGSAGANCSKNYALPPAVTAFDKKKIYSLPSRLDFGMLIKNGKLIFASEAKLYTADAAAFAREENYKLQSVNLPAQILGTGALYKDYIVLPLDVDNGTLFVYSFNMTPVLKIKLGCAPTKGLVCFDKYIVCVCEKTLFIIDMSKGAVIYNKRFNETILSTPSVIKINNTLHVCFGTLSSLYGVSVADLKEKHIYNFAGQNIAANTNSKIMRNRLVSYNNALYWVERGSMNYSLVSYNGFKIKKYTVPQAFTEAGIITQPIFSAGNVYLGIKDGVICAKANEKEEEWVFLRTKKYAKKVGDICVVAGEPVVNFATETDNAQIKAISKNNVFCADAQKGDIYVIRI